MRSRARLSARVDLTQLHKWHRQRFSHHIDHAGGVDDSGEVIEDGKGSDGIGWYIFINMLFNHIL